MYSNFKLLDSLGICDHFYDMCIKDAPQFRQHPEAKKFEHFFNMFDRATNLRSRRYYQNVFSQRHCPVVEKILSLPPPLNILDCGCGMGYDAMLFGLLGSKVIAVDIHEPSIYIALKLHELYMQRYPRLDVSIKHRDIFSFFEENQANFRHYFDIIWITEAISHIHPLEDFLIMVSSFLS